MRRLLAGALGLVLLLPACGAGGASPPDFTATPDLSTERDRIVAELTAVPALTGTEVRLSSGATTGNQVVIDAATTSADPAEQRVTLEEITRAGWHTAAFVPTEVRTSLVGPDGATLDPRDLGFPRRGADAAGLFAMFGPPAADEEWRP